MDATYDVIVIGAGPAGQNAAGRCAEGGLETAIVERQLVGGECSYWGCMPSKALLRPGEALAAARRVPGAREVGDRAPDLAAALTRRDRSTHGWDDSDQLTWLEDRGIDLVRGTARLLGERAVEVTNGGAPTRLAARRAVILATGTSAAMPPIEGLAEASPWTNRQAVAADAAPRRLLVLGGGVIGVELAQAWRRLGSEEVQVIEAADRLMAEEEPFAGDDVRAALEAEGVAVHLGARVIGVGRGRGGEVLASLDGGPTLIGDEVLVAVGRRPNTDGLGLGALGLEEGAYVEVDDQLRSTAVSGGWLYAVGDVNGRALLTHMGKYQARVAGDHILGRPAQAWADHHAVPRVAFTDPQVAAVGLTERQAREAGLDVRVVEHPTGGVAGSALHGGDAVGTSKLVLDGRRGVVVGATFTGREVGEMLHAATIAIAGQVTLDRLLHAVPAFPTVSEVWLRLMEKLDA